MYFSVNALNLSANSTQTGENLNWFPDCGELSGTRGQRCQGARRAACYIVPTLLSRYTFIQCFSFYIYVLQLNYQIYQNL